MAQGILINNFRAEYSENLLPEMTGTVVRNDGANLSVAYDTSRVFEGDKSIKVTFITPFGDVDRASFIINNYNTTIKKSGSHILSYRFYRDDNGIDDVETYFFVKVFVNGVLYDFNTFENDLRTDNGFDTSGWNTYAQNINVTEGDVILLRFEAYSNGNSTILYLDGLKLEYDDRFLGTPSIYSKPLVSENSTGFESKTDTTNVVSLTAATDNVMSLTATSISNGGLTLLDSNSKIIPIQLNDVLAIEFACTFETPTGTNQSIDILLRVGTSFYRGYNYKLTKGDGNDDHFSVNWNLPCGIDVMSNDVEIVLNPTSTMNYKDRYINVTRIHKAV